MFYLQPGFGYQQQLVPGMRPGGPPMMPNMFMPMVQPGQQGPRPGGRRPNAMPMQQGPQPVPVMQQQVGGTLSFALEDIFVYAKVFFLLTDGS